LCNRHVIHNRGLSPWYIIRHKGLGARAHIKLKLKKGPLVQKYWDS
jgi:hypothetical protein